ncbi:MAG: hypothetical protein KF726_10270 [Anaerolineae bacterium]|nr:hypothetical protein [Anaerolineae bacterium]
MNRWRGALLTMLVTLAVSSSAFSISKADSQPKCLQRVEWVYFPPETCLETVVQVPSTPGIISIAGLAFTPDGSLYFTRPAENAVWSVSPRADGYFSEPEPFAVSLPEQPFGLAYDAETESWFVSADTMIYRLRDTDQDGTADELTVLVRDLPGGAGGWLGDVRIGKDRRLYVAKAATCADCVDTDQRRSALLSFAMDGSNMRIIATGLTDAFSFDWTPDGALYIVDNVSQTQPAELNVVPANETNLNFREVAPVVTFDAGSHPTGLAYYDDPRFADYQRGLFVVFAGSWNNVAVTGHEMVFVQLDDNYKVMDVKRLIPNSQRSTSDASLIKTSLHPYRPYDLAIGVDGWLYMAIAEGRIYRFRHV